MAYYISHCRGRKKRRGIIFFNLCVFCVLCVFSVFLALFYDEIHIIMCLLMENFTIAIALMDANGMSIGSWCVL